MTELQLAWLARADRALRSAHLMLDADDVETCLNRCYYAMFYAAPAALVGRGESPRTHSGTHARFNLHFVKTGDLPRETSRLLTDAFEARQRSDYDTVSIFDTAAAADALADAEAFVAAVRPLVADI